MRGDYRKESDWDFLVIIDRNISFNQKKILIARIKRRIGMYNIPNDIIIKPEANFNSDKNIVGSISFYAEREGIIL